MPLKPAFTQKPNPLVLLISPCHKDFGGWYRASNISTHLGLNNKFIYNPRHSSNLLYNLLIGIRNCFHVLGADSVYIFECVYPQTLLPCVFTLLLRKKVILDIGDEWLDSPTYNRGNWLVRSIIRFLDTRFSRFFDITVTSDYLLNKYGRGLKVINGVNTDEFTPIPRSIARRILNIPQDAKVVLSLGNTFEGQRDKLIKETWRYFSRLYPQAILIYGLYIGKEELGLYLGACDLVLFPTGGRPNEQACFPIRIGTFLNAERVIATDDSDTEFHRILRPFNCMITGHSPEEIAHNMTRFFTNRVLETNVVKAKESLDWKNVIKELHGRL
jgi:hypothetical protein